MKVCRITLRETVFIFVTAALTITICSKSSILYPINDWVDANTYLTIGRAMLHGAVPYRDLYEQKGPLIYFFHAAAAAVSNSSFFGVFLLEIFACSVFLIVSFHIICNFCDRRHIAVIPLISMIVYSSGAFCHGDSAEELCLPLLSCSVCIIFSAFRSGVPLTKKQWFCSGVLAAAVFWIKFSITGLYAAFFISAIFLSLRTESLKELIYGILNAFLGTVALTAPIMLYFALNDVLCELFEVYIADNLFRYGGSSSIAANLFDGLKFTSVFLRIPAVVICLGAAALLFQKKFREFFLLLFMLVITFISIFGGHLSYRYYPLPLAVFLPVTASALIDSIKKRTSIVIRCASLTICALFCLWRSPNTYLMKYNKSDLPQYKFSEIIKSEHSPALLNYGFIDGGFYLASETVPKFKYFCRNNMNIPEMIIAQDLYIEQQIPDFIVMRSTKPKPDIAPKGYSLVSVAEFSYYEKYFYYFLYKKQLQFN